MRTQVIQLEIHDDIISARDKMNWAKAPRLVLIWPNRGRQILDRSIDLVLLARHSQYLGSQLALVVHDPKVRSHARTVGIPVFDKASAAQKATSWRAGKPRKKVSIPQNGKLVDLREERKKLTNPPAPWLAIPWVRLVIFSIGVIPVLVIAILFLPSAEIRVTPAQAEQILLLPLTANPEAKTESVSGSIPARMLSVIVSGESTLQTTGSMQVPNRAAAGKVQFTNLGETPVTIPSGLVVRTNDSPAIRFEVTQGGIVPAEVGGLLECPVKALEAGRQGNVEVGRVTAVEGGLGVLLSVTNSQAMTGGGAQAASAPSRADFEILREQLTQDLIRRAGDELEAKLGVEDVLIKSSIQLKRVVDEQFTPEFGEASDVLTLNLQAEYQASYVLAEDIRQVVRLVLDTTLLPGYEEKPGSLQVKLLETAEPPQNDVYIFDVEATRITQAIIKDEDIIRLALGTTLQTAQKRLSDSKGIYDGIEIHLNPDWWPFMPYLPFRIQVSRGGD